MRPGNLLASLRLAATLFALAIAATVPAIAQAARRNEPACPSPRPQDELWVISSRAVTCEPCQPPPVECLSAERYIPCAGWETAPIDEFLAADALDWITVFYATGNRDDVDDTLEDGLEVYQSLIACGSVADRIRFVIWSWPSDKICGPLRDFRVKAERTHCEAFLIGWVITQLAPEARLSLIGYSYGARIVSGALHLSAGGALRGRILPPAEALGAVRARALFLAPAFDNDWLLPGRRHGLALTQVDRLWTTHNPRDSVLKRYHLVEKNGDPIALGYLGPAAGPWPSDYLDRLDAQDVSPEIGKIHWMEAYLESPPIAAQLRAYALWAPIGPLDGAPPPETMLHE